MKQLESQPFQSKLNLNSEEFENNKSSMLEMISELNELLDEAEAGGGPDHHKSCLLYTSPSPRDLMRSRMPSSA